VVYEDFLKSLKIGISVVKRQGKNSLIKFRPEFLQYKERELELIELLRDSIENDFENFELNFQPQVYADTKILKGAEALLRWECEKYGKVSPLEFIPLLEKTDMIQTVGKWVFRQAVEMCKHWVCIYPQFSMSINVSYLLLFDPQFVDFMKDCVESAEISYQNIIVEITESKFISDKDLLMQVFDSVRTLGMKVAMDDFGTGYSSLNHIRELPIDIIKIDRCFIIDIGKDDYSEVFVKMVSELAETIGVHMCVEGVEENDQLQKLRDMKVKYIQGFYFGQPMRVEEFEKRYI